MDETEFKRTIEDLGKTRAPLELIELLHGISNIAEDKRLHDAFAHWCAAKFQMSDVKVDTEIDRHAFETFLQDSRLLPTRTAAAHLGMSRDSLDEVITALERTVLVNLRSASRQVIAESVIRDFHTNLLPILAAENRIFKDHDDFCSHLHAAILQDLKITVEPLRCETSEALGEDPPDFAYDHCCFTGRPIGVRYKVLLDFKKPINLRPDTCSMKFYAKHESGLKPFVFAGVLPNLPNGLHDIP